MPDQSGCTMTLSPSQRELCGAVPSRSGNAAAPQHRRHGKVDVGPQHPLVRGPLIGNVSRPASAEKAPSPLDPPHKQLRPAAPHRQEARVFIRGHKVAVRRPRRRNRGLIHPHIHPQQTAKGIAPLALPCEWALKKASTRSIASNYSRKPSTAACIPVAPGFVQSTISTA